MRDDYKEKIASKIAARYISLEERILQDIARRIKKTGEITSTADWQINRLRILGYSSEDIEREIKKVLDASYPEMFELYDKVIDWEYVRNKDIYEQINAEFIPYEENRQLQQITDAIIQQSLEDLENVTKSLGFYLDYNGRKVLTPLSQVYTNYLDNACFDVVTGAFDYGTRRPERLPDDCAECSPQTLRYNYPHGNTGAAHLRRDRRWRRRSPAGNPPPVQCDRRSSDS